MIAMVLLLTSYSAYHVVQHGNAASILGGSLGVLAIFFLYYCIITLSIIIVIIGIVINYYYYNNQLIQ